MDAFSRGGPPVRHPRAFGQRERDRIGLGRTGSVRYVFGRIIQARVPGRGSGLSRNAPRLLLGAARGGSGLRIAAGPKPRRPRTMRQRWQWYRTRPSGEVRGENASAFPPMESSVPGRILSKDAYPRLEPDQRTPVRSEGEGQGGGFGRRLWMCGSCDGPGFGRERGGGCLRPGRPASSDKGQPDRACDRTDRRLRTMEGKIANCG